MFSATIQLKALPTSEFGRTAGGTAKADLCLLGNLIAAYDPTAQFHFEISSAHFEECVHKILKLNIKEGQETEVITMLIDCCAMERMRNWVVGAT